MVDRRPDESKGPVLGLDLGDARIGVAISDRERRVAVPLGTIRTGAPEDLKAIARIVSERGVTEVVVGLPVTMAGQEGPAAEHARTLAGTLRTVLGLPVTLEDERLSTAEAERHLREAGVRGRARRGAVDRSAATVILQAHLDRGR